MARYGTELYGTVLYGGGLLNEFTTATFRATSNGYGRAFVEWSRPGGAWTHQRLVRSLVGPPIDEKDGDVLLEQVSAEATLALQDSGLTQGRRYYYALLVRDLDGQWRRTGSDEMLSVRDYGHSERLWSRVPQVFKGADYNTLDLHEPDEESSFLYRYLSLFGLQLDYVRSEVESLRQLYDPRVVSSRLLPALADHVGLQYEPELGDRAVRRIIANAMRLWSTKGTLSGIRELATSFAGWGAAVRLGPNIALDRLQAGPDGGRGHWAGQVNATVGYRAHPEGDRGPAGDGALVVTSRAAGTMLVAPVPPLAPPLERKLYAIPVIAGQDYRVSQYVRAAGTGLTVQVGMTWLDPDGRSVDASDFGPSVTPDDTWAARPTHVATCPSGARYLEPTVRVTGAQAAGRELLLCGLHVEEGLKQTSWAPAREVVVYLRGELTNYVGNTSGFGLSAEGWTGTVVVPEEDGGTFLAFVQDLVASDETVTALDGFTVEVPGDVSADRELLSYDDIEETTDPDSYEQRRFLYPTYQAIERAVPGDAQDGFVARYEAGVREVEQGQTWSVLVDVAGQVGDYDRPVEVGFALFDGPDLVGYEWSATQLVGRGYQTLTHELTIPANAIYDGVAFALRSADVIVGWRNAALVPTRLLEARQFDGTTPSSTGDYLWEGVPHRSATVYYSRRAARSVRLRELIEEFLPHPASYRLVFAADTIPDSPRASAGSDLDPDDSPFTQVGARARSRWKVVGRVEAQVQALWTVESLKVSRDVTLRWNLDQLHQLSTAVWGLQSLVTRDVALRWTSTATTTDSLALRWDVTTSLAATRDLRWNVLETSYDDVQLVWDTLGTPVERDAVLRWDIAENVIVVDAVAVDTTQTYATTGEQSIDYAERQQDYPLYQDATEDIP